MDLTLVLLGFCYMLSWKVGYPRCMCMIIHIGFCINCVVRFYSGRFCSVELLKALHKAAVFIELIFFQSLNNLEAT